MIKMMRADRLLANLGYGSRKDVTNIIKSGVFVVAGTCVTDPQMHVSLDDVKTKGATIEEQPLDPLFPLSIILHKPVGYVCSRDDGDGATIFELLPFRFNVRNPKLCPAGRLDKDTTGLVILTDDGEIMHKLISPRTHVEKIYQIQVRDAFKGDEAAIFGSGTLMLKSEKKPLLPVQFLPDGDRSARLVLKEGRYHQVRRMFGAIGNEVLSLHRSHVGGINLDNLPEGEWRILPAPELTAIITTPKAER